MKSTSAPDAGFELFHLPNRAAKVVLRCHRWLQQGDQRRCGATLSTSIMPFEDGTRPFEDGHLCEAPAAKAVQVPPWLRRR